MALLYCLQAPQQFLVTTQIVLEPRQPSQSTDAAAASTAPTLDSALADSQVQVIQSQRNLAYVFDVQNLAGDPEFSPSGFSPVGWLMDHIPFLKPAPLTPQEAAARSREAAFQTFAGQVAVRRLAQSYAFELSFYANDPKKAARIGNAITAAYVRDKMLYNIAAAAAQRGGDFLQNRIEDTRAERDAIETAVRTGVIPDVPFGHADARIISTAVAPLRKTYPRTTLILALAAAIGLVTGIGSVFVADELDRRVRSAARLFALTGLTATAELPRVRQVRRRPTALLDWTRSAPQSRFAVEMRKLRIVALQAAAGKAPRVGVIAASRGEGASAVAANLAHLIRQAVGPTTLVDADLASPDLSRALHPQGGRGLAECAAQGLDPNESISALEGGLFLLPAGNSADGAFASISGMAAVCASLASRHAVVVDLPPVADGVDGVELARALMGVIVVADAGACGVDDLRRLLDLLADSDVRVLGVAVNKSDVA